MVVLAVAAVEFCSLGSPFKLVLARGFLDTKAILAERHLLFRPLIRK
jgi:hypothetical protein